MLNFLECAGRMRADATETERADLGGLQRLDRDHTGDGSFMLGGRDEHDPIRRRKERGLPPGRPFEEATLRPVQVVVGNVLCGNPWAADRFGDSSGDGCGVGLVRDAKVEP